MSQTPPNVINGPVKWKSLDAVFPDGHIKARREQRTSPGKAESRVHWMHILINYSDTDTSARGRGRSIGLAFPAHLAISRTSVCVMLRKFGAV